jgi:hypothetical protein
MVLVIKCLPQNPGTCLRGRIVVGHSVLYLRNGEYIKASLGGRQHVNNTFCQTKTILQITNDEAPGLNGIVKKHKKNGCKQPPCMDATEAAVHNTTYFLKNAPLRWRWRLLLAVRKMSDNGNTVSLFDFVYSIPGTHLGVARGHLVQYSRPSMHEHIQFSKFPSNWGGAVSLAMPMHPWHYLQKV